jgi:hypothetical protein
MEGELAYVVSRHVAITDGRADGLLVENLK